MSDLGGFTVGIIGLGQIGGSLCAALKKRSPTTELLGYDRDTELSDKAIASGLISPQVHDAASLIENADIIVLATPLDMITYHLQTYRDPFRTRKLVTDTGSLKDHILSRANELGFSNFIGGHPIAGTERSGYESWSADLFVDVVYMYASTPRTNRQAQETFLKFVRIIGARPQAIDPVEHDALFAITSGLPHLTALALRRLLSEHPADPAMKAHMIGPSFRDATRVADSDPELVRQLVKLNGENMKVALRKLTGLLHEQGSTFSE